MTIVSRGYEGQIMPNVEWAEWQEAAGHEYMASSFDGGRVTTVTSGTRTVRVNVGNIGGHGILDKITVAQDITITDALPGVGQSKWYLIAARRTWQTVQATTLVAITGTATQAIPTRNTTPGTIDDQPLALVQITNGSTLPTAVVDLRPVSRQQGDYVIVEPAARDLVMSYMNKVGYRLTVDGVEWVRRTSGGSLVWSRSGQVGNTENASSGTSGTFTVNHNLGYVPTMVSGVLVRRVSGGSDQAALDNILRLSDVVVQAVTSSQIQFRLRRLDTVDWWSSAQPVRIAWTAL